MKAPFLIGRLMFGGYFLYAGINHLKNRQQMAPYAESKGVPAPESRSHGNWNPAHHRRHQHPSWT